MISEENRYLNNEDDNDLWDDELDLNSDDSSSDGFSAHAQSYDSDDSYNPYQAGNAQDEYAESQYADEDQSSSNGEDNDYYSDSESELPPRSSRDGRFFGSKSHEDEEDNDYFDSDEEPVEVKKTKAPKLDPEDPDYWIGEEESPLTGIIQQNRNKWKWWLGAAITFLVIILFCWIWFLRPYSDNATKYGYIKNMERRGLLIKTFEGTMIPYKEIGDPNPLYYQDLKFSVDNDSLAAVMKRMMIGCIPVRVEYELYHSALPWKGEEKMIIIKADTADPRKILPPEYRK